MSTTGHTCAAQPHVYAPGTMDLCAFSSAVSAAKSAVAFLIFVSHSRSCSTEQAASPLQSHSLRSRSPSATASARGADARIGFARLYRGAWCGAPYGTHGHGAVPRRVEARGASARAGGPEHARRAQDGGHLRPERAGRGVRAPAGVAGRGGGSPPPRRPSPTSSCWAAAAAAAAPKPLDARRWAEVVQAVLKRQAGVPLAPKDLRITFLLSDANLDEAPKKAVAHAMRRRSRARRRTTRTAPSARGPRPCRWRARSPRTSREARGVGRGARAWREGVCAGDGPAGFATGRAHDPHGATSGMTMCLGSRKTSHGHHGHHGHP